ncbi:hypothetical protein ACFYXM_10455 [Streptomyces sp. NPDC002476]|uniref:hypothetical protein n=1 Tax=Streptomyces sp. NPDC002476 TaxID=3364648 RepID=UPI0036BA4F4C
MTRLALLAPVTALLDQSSAPSDVPDSPDILHGGWLPHAARQALTLITGAHAAHAEASFTGNGHTYLLLHHDDDVALYLRTHAEGTPAPAEATEKTVTLTLAGTHYLECFRHRGDVEADHPWYLRAFPPESVYACHPGTLRAVETSPDGVQLVAARVRLAPEGRPLAADTYLDRLTAAQALIAPVLTGGRAATEASTR